MLLQCDSVRKAQEGKLDRNGSSCLCLKPFNNCSEKEDNDIAVISVRDLTLVHAQGSVSHVEIRSDVASG
jgi:hypothetical protein